ncbi:MAG: UDP-N-acetylmuramoyl-L-alanyl-D-glutamate--2,6-diaminopimelate ligase [bacterium]|nr:UDP-N-acetylmuramoyl-L-alanyl-D-glutamate--2,6-diaminopimelate ligase [bacterium]
MLSTIKKLIKRFLPESWLSHYHFILANLASRYYGNPSGKMIVIGITGTKGKSSVANFLWSCLQTAGHKTGILSTAIIRIGEEALPNRYHMTMPGRFKLQKLLREMNKAGCKFVIVETTSEGIKQSRHIGIDYDYAIFTNLYREHLASHNNNFDEYKMTKGKLFALLKEKGEAPKVLDGKTILKTSIINIDNPYSGYFLAFDADKKITYGTIPSADIVAKNILATETGSTFNIGDHKYELNIPGEFNVENSLPVIALCRSLDISEATIASGLANLKSIPGRMEAIDAGQDFKVYVDYAHQKESMEGLLNTAKTIVKRNNTKIILLLGAEGGGRDKGKRLDMGKLAGQIADYVVVSNVDPYDDDPKEIIEDIAKVVEAEGKVRGTFLFTIEDRREGIKKALTLAGPDDLVLITGKGSEQSIIIGGKETPWDDRTVTREEIQKLLEKKDA